MNVLITGGSGLLGTALRTRLEAGGHAVRVLTRRPGGAGAAFAWDPARGQLDMAALHGVDAVVHLAGDSIAGGRWTPHKKQSILESRVTGTRVLCEAIRAAAAPPATLISASGVGYYGDCGDELLTESSAGGRGFLADVCREWEAATAPAAERGLRVIHARLGMVLAAGGGALAKMLPAFRFGLGGVIGSGRQYMSWITLDDMARAFEHMLLRAGLRGAVNVASPRPATNRDFTRALGRALARPTWLPLPAFLARAMLGEMADDLLLSGARVVPRKLLDDGFVFAQPELEPALRALCSTPS